MASHANNSHQLYFHLPPPRIFMFLTFNSSTMLQRSAFSFGGEMVNFMCEPNWALGWSYTFIKVSGSLAFEWLINCPLQQIQQLVNQSRTQKGKILCYLGDEYSSLIEAYAIYFFSWTSNFVQNCIFKPLI